MKCVGAQIGCKNESTIATENGKVIAQDIKFGQVIDCDSSQLVIFWCRDCWNRAKYVCPD